MGIFAEYIASRKMRVVGTKTSFSEAFICFLEPCRIVEALSGPHEGHIFASSQAQYRRTKVRRDPIRGTEEIFVASGIGTLNQILIARIHVTGPGNSHGSSSYRGISLFRKMR